MLLFDQDVAGPVLAALVLCLIVSVVRFKRNWQNRCQGSRIEAMEVLSRQMELKMATPTTSLVSAVPPCDSQDCSTGDSTGSLEGFVRVPANGNNSAGFGSSAVMANGVEEARLDEGKQTKCEPITNACFVCKKPSKSRCSGCKSVYYCGSEHQTSDWKKRHSGDCKEMQRKKRRAELAEANAKGTALALENKASESAAQLAPPDRVLFDYERFVELFEWDRLRKPPCGLINCGNSCFANAVLQCLTYTRPLVAFLLDGGHRDNCHKREWCFMCELQDHVVRARNDTLPFSAFRILSRIRSIGPHLGFGRQEDAHEFVRFAIDSMQTTCVQEAGGEKDIPPRVRETTLIDHIFGGYFQSQVQCLSCGYQSNVYESTMDLTVEIQSPLVESLEQALEQFTAPEYLEGDNAYKCEKCKKMVRAQKRMRVHEAPNILTVSFKRFQAGRFGKLNKKVTFPEVLDMAPYMSQQGDVNPPPYNLYAVLVHLDLLNSSFFGHYVCYVKDSLRRWYKIDDSIVKEVPPAKVLAQRAYLLFYARSSPRPLATSGQDSGPTTSSTLPRPTVARHLADPAASSSCSDDTSDVTTQGSYYRNGRLLADEARNDTSERLVAGPRDLQLPEDIDWATVALAPDAASRKVPAQSANATPSPSTSATLDGSESPSSPLPSDLTVARAHSKSAMGSVGPSKPRMEALREARGAGGRLGGGSDGAGANGGEDALRAEGGASANGDVPVLRDSWRASGHMAGDEWQTDAQDMGAGEWLEQEGWRGEGSQLGIGASGDTGRGRAPLSRSWASQSDVANEDDDEDSEEAPSMYDSSYLRESWHVSRDYPGEIASNHDDVWMDEYEDDGGFNSYLDGRGMAVGLGGGAPVPYYGGNGRLDMGRRPARLQVEGLGEDMNELDEYSLASYLPGSCPAAVEAPGPSRAPLPAPSPGVELTWTPPVQPLSTSRDFHGTLEDEEVERRGAGLYWEDEESERESLEVGREAASWVHPGMYRQGGDSACTPQSEASSDGFVEVAKGTVAPPPTPNSEEVPRAARYDLARQLSRVAEERGGMEWLRGDAVSSGGGGGEAREVEGEIGREDEERKRGGDKGRGSEARDPGLDGSADVALPAGSAAAVLLEGDEVAAGRRVRSKVVGLSGSIRKAGGLCTGCAEERGDVVLAQARLCSQCGPSGQPAGAERAGEERGLGGGRGNVGERGEPEVECAGGSVATSMREKEWGASVGCGVEGGQQGAGAAVAGDSGPLWAGTADEAPSLVVANGRRGCEGVGAGSPVARSAAASADVAVASLGEVGGGGGGPSKGRLDSQGSNGGLAVRTPVSKMPPPDANGAVAGGKEQPREGPGGLREEEHRLFSSCPAELRAGEEGVDGPFLGRIEKNKSDLEPLSSAPASGPKGAVSAGGKAASRRVERGGAGRAAGSEAAARVYDDVGADPRGGGGGVLSLSVDSDESFHTPYSSPLALSDGETPPGSRGSRALDAADFALVARTLEWAMERDEHAASYSGGSRSPPPPPSWPKVHSNSLEAFGIPPIRGSAPWGGDDDPAPSMLKTDLAAATASALGTNGSTLLRSPLRGMGKDEEGGERMVQSQKHGNGGSQAPPPPAAVSAKVTVDGPGGPRGEGEKDDAMVAAPAAPSALRPHCGGPGGSAGEVATCEERGSTAGAAPEAVPEVNAVERAVARSVAGLFVGQREAVEESSQSLLDPAVQSSTMTAVSNGKGLLVAEAREGGKRGSSGAPRQVPEPDSQPGARGGKPGAGGVSGGVTGDAKGSGIVAGNGSVSINGNGNGTDCASPKLKPAFQKGFLDRPRQRPLVTGTGRSGKDIAGLGQEGLAGNGVVGGKANGKVNGGSLSEMGTVGKMVKQGHGRGGGVSEGGCNGVMTGAALGKENGGGDLVGAAVSSSMGGAVGESYAEMAGIEAGERSKLSEHARANGVVGGLSGNLNGKARQNGEVREIQQKLQKASNGNSAPIRAAEAKSRGPVNMVKGNGNLAGNGTSTGKHPPANGGTGKRKASSNGAVSMSAGQSRPNAELSLTTADVGKEEESENRLPLTAHEMRRLMGQASATAKAEKRKPNDPCSCNSGMKWKKCCGKGGKFSVAPATQKKIAI